MTRVYVKSFETKVAMEGLLHFVSGKTVKIPEDKGDPQKVGHQFWSFDESLKLAEIIMNRPL